MRKINTAIMLFVMYAAMLLSACGGVAMSTSTPTVTQTAQTEKTVEETKEGVQETPVPAGDAVTIQIGFENITEGPIDKAAEKWAGPLAAGNSGTMKPELFPNSPLGSKSELIDQVIMGEDIITVTDGAFYVDHGVPDLGTLYGPFFFDNWDEVWKLIDSDWYQTGYGKLVNKGPAVLASNWAYGECELMIKTKVVTPTDIKGRKVHPANSQIYVEGSNALGTTTVSMALGDVYTSLQNGTLDGMENPLSTPYGQSFQETSRSILMVGHILSFTTWCTEIDYLDILIPEQQELLYGTGEKAGLHSNEQQATANDDHRKKLEEAGVAFTEPTDEERALWKGASLSFHEKGSQFGWSDGLYDVVKVAMQ